MCLVEEGPPLISELFLDMFCFVSLRRLIFSNWFPISYVIFLFVCWSCFRYVFCGLCSPRDSQEGEHVAKTLYCRSKSGCRAFLCFLVFSCFGGPSGSPLGTLLVTVGVPGALPGDPWRQKVAQSREKDVFFFALDSQGRPERPKGAPGPQKDTKMTQQDTTSGAKSHPVMLPSLSLFSLFVLFFLSLFSLFFLSFFFAFFSHFFLSLFSPFSSFSVRAFLWFCFSVFFRCGERDREKEKEKEKEKTRQQMKQSSMLRCFPVLCQYRFRKAPCELKVYL